MEDGASEGHGGRRRGHRQARGHALVVAGHPEAARLGATVLEHGGTAMDAAVTVSIALGVSEPYGSGIGGKLLMLYMRPGDSTPWVIDGMDAAPASWDVAAYRKIPKLQRRHSWASAAVPGTIPALHAGHRRWGSLPWDELVEPVAKLAERGPKVLPGTREMIEAAAYRLTDSSLREWLMPGGRPPEVGRRLPFPDHAAFLRELARRGPEWFMGREMADRVASASRGQFQSSDWDFEPRDSDAMGMKLASGQTLWGAPPPTVGGALIASYFRDHAPEAVRADAQALDAFGRRYRALDAFLRDRVGDTPEARAMIEAFWRGPDTPGRGTIAAETEEIDEADDVEEDSAPESTTHFNVVDRHGAVAAVTQSLSHHFGAGVSIPGTGVILNNSLTNFCYSEMARANRPAPGRRPRSTIAPSVVTDGRGEPIVVFGLPGGARIPSTLVQVMSDYWAGVDLGESISAPRWHPIRPRRGDLPSRWLWDPEDEPEADLLGALQTKGWEFRRSGHPEAFGGVTAIVRDSDGQWTGYADGRRTNAVSVARGER